MSLNLVFSLAFSALFQRVGWAPHGGLALANSAATALEMGGLLVLMRRRLRGLEGRKILVGLGQALVATLIMSTVLWLWGNRIVVQSAWLATGGGVVLGAGVFGLIVWVIGVREARDLWEALVTRLKRSVT
jgi:putative peptidoglycan lipid II flippase